VFSPGPGMIESWTALAYRRRPRPGQAGVLRFARQHVPAAVRSLAPAGHLARATGSQRVRGQVPLAAAAVLELPKLIASPPSADCATGSRARRVGSRPALLLGTMACSRRDPLQVLLRQGPEPPVGGPPLHQVVRHLPHWQPVRSTKKTESMMSRHAYSIAGRPFAFGRDSRNGKMAAKPSSEMSLS